MSDTPGNIAVYERVPDRLWVKAVALEQASFQISHETAEQCAERHDRFCSQSDVVRRLLVTRENDVVGCATLYRRSIAVDGQPIELGGLGDVSVAPAHRRQGIATDLALAAMLVLREIGCDVAYLCADVHLPHMVTLYGRAGFAVLGRPHTYVGASGRRYVDHDAMIAPVQSRAIFEQILADIAPFDIGRGNW